MDVRQIRRAWETFMADGVADPAVSRTVAASWQRSRSHEVRIQSSKAPLAEEAEIFRHKLECAALVSAARPVFSRSSPLLSDADAMLILTDTTGMILDTQGDERVIEDGREIHLEHGGRWREADIGTNAIGTAVAMARPVQIHGPEHFCSDIQKWTCAASPVRHPFDHEVLGVVDISGPAEKFIPQSLALAVSISHHIEDNLARATMQDRERLLDQSISKLSRWNSDELIVVDRRGAILHASDTAMRTLRLARPDLVVDRSIPSLRSTPATQWPRRLAALLPQANVELISDDASHMGAIIVLRSARRLATARGPVPIVRSRVGTVSPLAGLEPGQRPQPAVERTSSERPAPSPMVAEDPAVGKLAQRVELAAARKMPILVLGETGTGKEQMARHAHAAAGRKGAFVPVNCAALTESLAEAELFGYADGAFTGARRGGAVGFAQQADGGTLFLDEIGDMPIALQAVLLRFLDDWTVRPIGGTSSKVDVFLVSATNMTLAKAIAEGRFRSDLLYRLNTVEVSLPRLAEREDFFAIARKLLAGIAPDCSITDAALRRLAQRPWPGNIRELRNVLTRTTLNAEAAVIDAAMIEDVQPCAAAAPPAARTLQETGAAQVRATYEEVGRNISATARRLGISRNTVYRLLEKAPRRAS